MITKNDWDDALDAWVEDERERLGGPPSPEEVVAFLSGALSPADAARVRTLLVYYPELTDLLTERIEQPRVSWKPAALRVYAVAATLVIAMLAIAVAREWKTNTQPSFHTARHELTSFPTRGIAPVQEIAGGQQRYRIVAVPSQLPADGEYEIEITRGKAVLWRAGGVPPVDGAFDISVPGAFLKPGEYALNVYAPHDAERRLIEHYRFRVLDR